MDAAGSVALVHDQVIVALIWFNADLKCRMVLNQTGITGSGHHVREVGGPSSGWVGYWMPVRNDVDPN